MLMFLSYLKLQQNLVRYFTCTQIVFIICVCVCVFVHCMTLIYLFAYLDVFFERAYSLYYFSPNSGQWCLALANVSNSSKSSNLCSFSDKPRHLVVLAWDAGCTMGCCKLCAWSGPGTPHLMGNSLNSAH